MPSVLQLFICMHMLSRMITEVGNSLSSGTGPVQAQNVARGARGQRHTRQTGASYRSGARPGPLHSNASRDQHNFLQDGAPLQGQQHTGMDIDGPIDPSDDAMQVPGNK